MPKAAGNSQAENVTIHCTRPCENKHSLSTPQLDLTYTKISGKEVGQHWKPSDLQKTSDFKKTKARLVNRLSFRMSNVQFIKNGNNRNSPTCNLTMSKSTSFPPQTCRASIHAK